MEGRPAHRAAHRRSGFAPASIETRPNVRSEVFRSSDITVPRRSGSGPPPGWPSDRRKSRSASSVGLTCFEHGVRPARCHRTPRHTATPLLQFLQDLSHTIIAAAAWRPLGPQCKACWRALSSAAAVAWMLLAQKELSAEMGTPVAGAVLFPAGNTGLVANCGTERGGGSDVGFAEEDLPLAGWLCSLRP